MRGASLKDLNAQLEREKKNLKDELEHKLNLGDFLQELENRVQDGNLSLTKLELPQVRLDAQDDE